MRWGSAGVAVLLIAFAAVSVEQGTRTPESPLSLPPLVIEEGETQQLLHVDVASPESVQAVVALPPAADGAIISWVQENARRLTPPFLMILAERLFGYDREAAAAWYHIGMIRGRYDASRCTDRTADPALEMLDTLAPRTGGYLRAQPALWAESAHQAVSRAFAEPELNSPWWICKHALSALRAGVRGSSLADWVRPEEDWAALRAAAVSRHEDLAREVGNGADAE